MKKFHLMKTLSYNIPLKENSCRLKKLFAPFNPIFGDPGDPDRFLFNVKGIRKTYLPLSMKEFPFIRNLMDSGSISKFIRSPFFKQNFSSVSQVFSLIKSTRLKYDFPIWAKPLKTLWLWIRLLLHTFKGVEST